MSLFRATFFVNHDAMKSHGSSTTAKNAEVTLIQTNVVEAIKHVQLTLLHELGHKKA